MFLTWSLGKEPRQCLSQINLKQPPFLIHVSNIYPVAAHFAAYNLFKKME